MLDLGPVPRCLLLTVATTLAAAGCASRSATVASPSPFPNAPMPVRAGVAPARSTLATDIVAAALALRGTRYRLGGERPSTGFDCSGLVRYVFLEHQIAVPRTVAEQFHAGTKVPEKQIAPGDLLFFSTSPGGPSHVGIALDASTFVHAPGSGRVVRVERFDTPYWSSRFAGVRRISATASP